MNGNAPVPLFQPVWIAIMVGAILFFFVSKKLVIFNQKEKLKTMLLQICLSAVVALFVGFGLTWLAENMLGIAIPDFLSVSLFLSLSCFAFIVMIASVLLWTGFGGIGIFAFLMFFSAPLLSLAPEFMPSFYENWIYPWLPMRFMVDGLRDLLFFENGTYLANSITVMVCICLVRPLVILASLLKKSNSSDGVPAKPIK